MEKLNKIVYLSDIHNKEELREELSNSIHIFDKDEISIKSKSTSKKVLDFFNNSQLADNLTGALKNKKISTIVYLLYMSNTKDVINTINTIIEKNLIDVDVTYKYICYKDDYEPTDIDTEVITEVILK